MTPPDGSDFDQGGTPAAARLAVALGIVLPGGRSLLAFEGQGAQPPGRARLGLGGRRGAWIARCWPRPGGGWAGLALIDGPLAEPAEIEAEAATQTGRWRLTPPVRLDVAPEPLAEFVRAAGLPGRDVFGFLTEHLLESAEGEGGRMQRDFAAGFITAAAEADGFVEIVASPETGGFFAQGWSLSLGSGPTMLARVEGGLAVTEAEVAVFAREDILPPGHGFCLFVRDWRDIDPAHVGPVFFERDGRLKRLDLVKGQAVHLAPDVATGHVAHMLPRLEGEGLPAFRRICRPRFQGEDTLSDTRLPIAAGFDAVFQAPDGSVLVMGWLLDPLARVERVLVKGKGLYAPLQDQWHAVARPDLNAGFAADPRFARMLDDRDVMHGFIAFAPGRKPAAETEAYLELVLDDNACLFRPLTVTRLETRDRAAQILASVPLHDPGLDLLVSGALAPFLAALPPGRRPVRAGTRPLTLGKPAPARDIAAIMPFRSLAQIQPVVALLAGTPEAEALELTLVTGRTAAIGLTERLSDMFAFYGLTGRLALTPDQESFAAQVEAGLAATQAERLLVWSPSALPTAPGWLAQMVAAQDDLARPGLVSPALLYEDGSIYYGGGGDAGGAGALTGYGGDWLPKTGLRPAATGAAEIALVDRATLTRAGGFSGGLMGDALGHRDLARRLRAAGAGTWVAPAVRFWMLQDAPAESQDPLARLLRKIDAALVAPQETIR